MRNLPRAIIQVLRPFELLVSARVWQWAKILLIGAIVAPGKRTVTAALRVMGRSNARQFQNYHRVLNRAVWSPRARSRVLLRLLLEACVPADAPVVLGLDDHIERRRGAKISATGIDRDPVRSSKSFFVTTSGLRWLCLMLLAPIPWAERVWALPFLTVLAPSERSHQQPGQRHTQLTDWARQMITQVRAWLPERLLVVVADRSYAALELLAACQQLPQPVSVVPRLRLDAALYHPAPAPQPRQVGRPRTTGERQPTRAARLSDPTTIWQDTIVRWDGGSTRRVQLATTTAVWYHSGMPPVAIRGVLIRDGEGTFEPQALLSTNQELTAEQIVEWFVMRWQSEVTFEEARAHLGIETQRQWSDNAIARTTPLLLGLCSLVSLVAHHLLQGQELPTRQAAWYSKELPTFSDTLAFVRQQLWPVSISWMSPEEADMVKIPRSLLDRFTDALAYAA
jgi:hypothetical protein